MNANTMKKLENQAKVQEELSLWLARKDVYLHHSGLDSGSLPRTKGVVVNDYNGKFGSGFTVDVPEWPAEGKHYNRCHRRYYFLFV